MFTEVRGVGAVWAAQLGGDDETPRGLRIRDRMLDLGVVCRSINGAISFCPPLVIDDADVARLVDITQQAVGEIPAGSS